MKQNPPLTRLITLFPNRTYKQNTVKMKDLPETPETRNGLIKIIRIDNPTAPKKVKTRKITFTLNFYVEVYVSLRMFKTRKITLMLDFFISLLMV